MEIAEGQIRFAIHSSQRDDPDDKEVDAAIFASKLGALVRALKAADKAVNRGQAAHEYVIARLHTSTPTAILAERPIVSNLMAVSGIVGFNDCTTAITLGEREQALRFGSCAQNIERLATGSEQKFGYAEVASRDNIIRIDPFLRERARAIVSPSTITATRADPTQQWFKGVAHGSFVGSVQAVDLRGKLPAIKLILSAGGKTIDCICHSLDVERIRSALNRRVRVSGRAIYDGKAGLPRRIEVRDILNIEEADDFTRWRGAFEPFSSPGWEGHDND
jgi:hypothetical protein